MRRACGWRDDAEMPDVDAVDAYLERLSRFAVLDPACGSGAFLITALRYLATEWKRTRAVRARLAGQAEFEETEAALIGRLLRDNIYGVDINPASVEIAQLALWLHTARADQPLSSLDETVRCGNTLVTEAFYTGIQLGLYDETRRERINAFDWRSAFPAVAARGGFDAVVGNPPYVKLQNFRPAYPDVAEYLVRGRPGVAAPPYASTRTGNFDLYLPFIEQGLAMLNANGRLGYIAPSLWTVNEYGAGLRALVGKQHQLDRWLDFKSYQVFEEATTYTALQFFCKSATEAIRVAQAPAGVMPPDPWADAGQRLSWGCEDFGDRWLLLTGAERALVDRLAATCGRLGDVAQTEAIFVGVQTSADSIYHLKRIGAGRYLCAPPGSPRPKPFEVSIEDEIMRPLISGTEAKRYQEPRTETWILFPYSIVADQARLIGASVMEVSYPKAWAYLRSFEKDLRGREASRDAQGHPIRPFDDDAWYRFGRNQNLDKQHRRKVVVPRLVSRLVCFVDEAGAFCLDNVDVGGVLVAEDKSPWFVAGILNAPVADWVFQRISKPFRGNYLSANRQFIAPLPVPTTAGTQRADIAGRAEELQRSHSRRRDILAGIARRIEIVARRARPDTWLFAGLAPPHEREAQAPASLDAARRQAWARSAYALELAARHDALTAALQAGATLSAESVSGELRFLADGVPVIDRVFVTEAESAFMLAQWKIAASKLQASNKLDGNKLAKALRTLASPDNPAVVEQVVGAVAELETCEAAIRAGEQAMNEAVFDLYGLTAAERALVEAG